LCNTLLQASHNKHNKTDQDLGIVTKVRKIEPMKMNKFWSNIITHRRHVDYQKLMAVVTAPGQNPALWLLPFAKN
jgi:hypothetical protein